jgi:hypothetical protein
MTSRQRIAIGLALAVLLSWEAPSVTGQATEAAGAKALFFDPVSGTMLNEQERQRTNPKNGKTRIKPIQARQAKYIGLHYWIELEGVGSVTDERVFHTGEAIQLHIRSNVDGYLALWSLDSSGRGKQLFPMAGHAIGDGLVKADSEYVTPCCIKFALPVEDERLLVFFSRSRAELPVPAGSPEDADVIAKSLEPKGSKALVFETERSSTAEIGTYVVNKTGGAVAKEIRLRHQSPAAGT